MYLRRVSSYNVSRDHGLHRTYVGSPNISPDLIIIIRQLISDMIKMETKSLFIPNTLSFLYTLSMEMNIYNKTCT